MACFTTLVCLLISGCGGQQKTDENRIIHIELYQYNNEIYCKVRFDFSDQEYTAKLPAEISAQVEKLETEGQ